MPARSILNGYLRQICSFKARIFIIFFERRTLTSTFILSSTILSLSKIVSWELNFYCLPPERLTVNNRTLWFFRLQDCFASWRTRNCNNLKQKEANNHSKWCVKAVLRYALKISFYPESSNDWPKRQNWLIPCKGRQRHFPSLFFGLRKKVRKSCLVRYQTVLTFWLVSCLTFRFGNSIRDNIGRQLFCKTLLSFCKTLFFYAASLLYQFCTILASNHS